jgi:hypothetical protein
MVVEDEVFEVVIILDDWRRDSSVIMLSYYLSISSLKNLS